MLRSCEHQPVYEAGQAPPFSALQHGSWIPSGLTNSRVRRHILTNAERNSARRLYGCMDVRWLRCRNRCLVDVFEPVTTLSRVPYQQILNSVLGRLL